MASSLRLFALVIFAAVACTAAKGGKRYRVGGPDGWNVPPPEDREMYVKWASGITFYVDDSIEFVYKNNSVIKVDKVGYYHCNNTATVAATPRDGTTLFRLDAPGYAYFASGDFQHCSNGQRLMVNVLAHQTPPPSPAPPLPPTSLAPSPSPSSQASAAASSSVLSFSHALAPVALALLGLVRA